MNNKQSKSFDYGGSSYAVVESAATANIAVGTTPSYLPLPTTDDDFFAIEGATNRITFKRRGYVNISLTAKIITSDEMDLQIVSNRGPITRKNFNADGYILIEFGFEVQDVATDWLVVQMQDKISGLFLYVAEDTATGLLAQPPFTIHLSFTDDLDRADDSIGELFFSADGTLEGKTNAIKLWGTRTFPIAMYPKLYAKIRGTALISADDGSNFTILNMANFRYLAAGNVIAQATANLPKPNLNEAGAGSVTFGTSSEKYDMNTPTGSLGTSSFFNESTTWGGDAAAGDNLNFIRITLNIADHDHSVADGNSYSDTLEVRPNTLQTFLYIRCDII